LLDLIINRPHYCSNNTTTNHESEICNLKVVNQQKMMTLKLWLIQKM